MNELISVVIPVYNVAPFLADCLDSITGQTYDNLEIILVDDGSTDEGGRVCDEAASRDSRIKVLHTANGGLSAARNRGMEVATGEYIYFLDSDDCIAKDTIEILAGMCSGGAEIAIGNYIRFKDDIANLPKGLDERDAAPVMMDTKEAMRRMLANEGYTHCSWNKLFRRSLWDGITFPEGKLYEDLCTSFKVVPLAEKVAYIDLPLYYYRVRSGSIMRSNIKEKNLNLLDFMEEVASSVTGQFPDLAPFARDLTARTYMKLYKNILDTGMDIFPEAQKRITDYIKNNKDALLSSPVTKNTEKIKIHALCAGKKIFYAAYRLGDLKNKDM